MSGVQVLDIENALRAYAEMMNTLDVAKIEPLLASNFCYASQMVLTELTSKQAYLYYMAGKFVTLKSNGSRVWAELGLLDREFPGPCVVLAQGDKDNLVALVLAKVKDGKISRLDMCVVPSPRDAKRSNDYPGISVID